MTIAKTAFVTKTPAIEKNVAYVVGVTNTKSKLTLAESMIDTSSISAVDLNAINAKSNAEHLVRVATVDGAVFALVGIGESELDSESLRKIAGAAVRSLGEFKEIKIGLPATNVEQAAAILEGALLGNYDFVSYKSGKTAARQTKSITVVSPFKVDNDLTEKVASTVSAITSIRDLANTPPNVLYPQTLAATFQKAAKAAGVSIEVWDEKRLAAESMVGILAVGQGSSRPPRLVKIEYKPRGAKKHLALVGKGITFDSGGLTLKPGVGMIGMKYDMTGAATVGNAVLAIAAQKIPVHVTAYLCVAENLPSGTAQRPNDVLRYRNGKTVEVTNTDAEGRLVLADGLILASEQKPDLIVDVATLTGAASVALGVRYTGLMGNPEGVEIIEKAAKQSGELVWQMPLAAELRAMLHSETADMINSKLGDPTGGMMVGGVFLNEFVGNKSDKADDQLPWAHLDIAGSAKNSVGAYGYAPKGSTGVMLRTLIETAKALV